MLVSAYSQINRLSQNVCANVATQLMLWNDIQMAACDFNQALLKCQALIEHIVAPRQVDKKIDVTVGAFFATSNRAEHSYAPCAKFVASVVDNGPLFV